MNASQKLKCMILLSCQKFKHNGPINGGSYLFSFQNILLPISTCSNSASEVLVWSLVYSPGFMLSCTYPPQSNTKLRSTTTCQSIVSLHYKVDIWTVHTGCTLLQNLHNTLATCAFSLPSFSSLPHHTPWCLLFLHRRKGPDGKQEKQSL